MTANLFFYRNNFFIETLLKHFCLVMSPIVSGRGSQYHPKVNWLESSLNEGIPVIPAGYELLTLEEIYRNMQKQSASSN